MTLTFYFDVWPGLHPTAGLFATTTPGTKTPGCKRYRVDVEIPDLADPDAVVRTAAVLVPGDGGAAAIVRPVDEVARG